MLVGGFVLTLHLLWFSVVVAETQCDKNTLGRPLAKYCSDALASIKGAEGGSKIPGEILHSRLFIEPQYLEPAFHKVAPNPFKMTLSRCQRYGEWVSELPLFILSHVCKLWIQSRVADRTLYGRNLPFGFDDLCRSGWKY